MLGVRRGLAVLVVGVATLLGSPLVLAARAQSSQEQTLAQALGGGLQASRGASAAYVVDLNTGGVLYSSGSQAGHLPASVEKLYTTSTALLRFGPNATLTTQLLGSGSLANGTWHGTLVLRGGGDPTFGSASFDQTNYGRGATMQTLVRNLIRATGIKAIRGAILADGSIFDSKRGTPATGYARSIEVEGELDGVAYDRGWLTADGTVFQARPTLFAARRLMDALRAAGVRVSSATRVSTGSAPPGARQLAAVSSPKMATLLALTNTPSDNYFAETLLKDVGARFGGGGSTAAGANVVRAEVGNVFGIRPTLNDGSGLSRFDSTTPLQVVTLLQKMAGNSNFVGSLAVAGETGTLQGVNRGTIAQGRCRGKTGTLNDTANLAGYCQARDGHTLAFAFLSDGLSNPNYVHDLIQARMTTALANYDG
jgi:D-alanyl-D-alanine carboxypeptidase/D-alanyl-D-alanine-endopeptidase (penicillin-binding protein 4)